MKKNITFFVLVFFLICCNKKRNVDSKLNIPTDSLSYFISQSSNTKLPNDIRLSSNNNAFETLKKINTSNKNRGYLLSVAENFYNLQNNKEFIATLDYTLQKSKQANDSVLIGKIYNRKANYYIDEGKLDSSYIFFVKAEKIFKKLNDNINLGINYLEKGYVQISINDYFGCEQSSSLALIYLKNAGLYNKEYYAYNYIGICSNELENYENAILYHKKAYEIAKKENFSGKFHYQSVSLNNIGVVYQKLNNHKDAITNFKLALNDKDLIKDNPDLYAKLLDNLAFSNFKLNDYSELPGLFYKSLEITERLNLNPLISNKLHLSEYYQTLKDTSKSIMFAKKALEESKLQNAKGDLLFSLKQLSLLDKKNSAQYSREYIKISDSIQVAERKSKEKFARLQYETDEIIQEKDSLAEKNRNLLYVFVVSFIIVVLLFVVRAQRARTRELLYKQAQQKANEDIYNLMMSQQAIIDESRNKEKKRLAQDLHDGVLGRMFGLRLNLDSLNHNNDDDSVKRRFELLNELKTIEQDIREISHDLNREKQVLINNFVSIVHNLLEEQKTSHEANVVYTIDNDVEWDKIGNNIKINMYRILQEGLQNINKYANAKNIHVEVKGDKENVYLKIQDDGVGFDVNRKSKGIGMQNMISRTNDCQGIIDITSKKDHGTKIVITLPIETKQQLIIEEA